MEPEECSTCRNDGRPECPECSGAGDTLIKGYRIVWPNGHPYDAIVYDSYDRAWLQAFCYADLDEELQIVGVPQ